MPPSGITGAVFVRGRLLLAGEGERYQIWSVNTKTGGRRLEFETEMCGEAEGLDTISTLGGELHWLLSPIDDCELTYPPSSALVHLVRAAGQGAAAGEGRRLDGSRVPAALALRGRVTPPRAGRSAAPVVTFAGAQRAHQQARVAPRVGTRSRCPGATRRSPATAAATGSRSSCRSAPTDSAGPAALGNRLSRMLRPLRHRDFRLLWTGQAISLIGDGIYLVAIAWLVYDISNSPGALGLVGVAWTLPMVLTLLGAGVLSDRYDRRLLMIVADVLRVVAVGASGRAHARRRRRSCGTWSCSSCVYGVGDALFAPAFTAIVPDVVPQEDILQASALKELMEPVGLRFAGPALGGFLIAGLDVGAALVVDAATFAASAVAVSFMSPQPGVGQRGRVCLGGAARGLRVRARAALAVGDARQRGALPARELRPVRGAACRT